MAMRRCLSCLLQELHLLVIPLFSLLKCLNLAGFLTLHLAELWKYQQKVSKRQHV